MFILIEVVSTSEENCFKKFSFFTKFVDENIELIDDFVDKILFRMQNSFV